MLIFACLIVAGTLFLGKVWGKIRPMVEIQDEEGVEHHAGISHSQKSGMIPITQDDIQEPTDFEVGDDAYVGLCNKSSMKLKYGDLGNTKDEIDQQILNAKPKLRDKTKKRSKKK